MREKRVIAFDLLRYLFRNGIYIFNMYTRKGASEIAGQPEEEITSFIRASVCTHCVTLGRFGFFRSDSLVLSELLVLATTGRIVVGNITTRFFVGTNGNRAIRRVTNLSWIGQIFQVDSLGNDFILGSASERFLIRLCAP